MDKVTIDKLAEMVSVGFNDVKGDIKQVNGRLDSMDGRLDSIDGRLDHMDARLGRLEADVHEMAENIVYRHEFEDLSGRVKYLEKRMGIESGK
ncbi:MAG: hypothetical protein HYT98_03835 [Candidatus Sungbacteria bacterium]|nr:hypothetical protein [Candidatus Sungbacteria bacterium]